MKKSVFYLLLLGILESILFFKLQYGINVLLFIIPFCIFLIYYLKGNELIKNKKGFLFLIPILIISTMYMVYDNVFSFLNMIAIPALFVIMIITIVNPKEQLGEFIKGCFKFVFGPFDHLDKYNKSVKAYTKDNLHLTDKQKQIIKSIIVVVPIVIIILLLLSSADMMFHNLLSFIPDNWGDFSFSSLLGRIFRFCIFFFYVGASTVYWKETLINDKIETKSKKISEYTIVLLLTVLNIIYVVFDIIQIRSLWLHQVSTDISYAEYARSGFFQLMVISLINLVIILLSKKAKESNYIKGMSTVMIGLTLIIIVSSFFRMFLYEQAYGYTELRLGVYCILITETILLIPTMIYIFQKKFPLLKYYIVIITCVYTLVNCVSIDQIIAKNNISRYDRTGKIDIDYLMNYNSDNMKQLVDLYKRTDDVDMKIELEVYFESMRKELKDRKILEYNVSKEKAYSLIKEKRD